MSKKFALLKKPTNPSRFLTHLAAPELFALCVIPAVFLKGGKMFPQIVHNSRFRHPSPGRCPLVAELAGTTLSNKEDSNTLQNPYCDAGQRHMHFNGTDGFQYFFAGMLIFDLFQGCGFPFLPVIIQPWHVL